MKYLRCQHFVFSLIQSVFIIGVLFIPNVFAGPSYPAEEPRLSNSITNHDKACIGTVTGGIEAHVLLAKSKPPKCNVDTMTPDIIKAPTIEEFYKKFVEAYKRPPNLLEKNCWRRYFYWKKSQQNHYKQD